MLTRFHSWRGDRLLRGVLKSSAYLFSSNSITALLSFAQGIFAVRLLGIDGYGLVSGTVIVFVSNLHRLLSFRMSEPLVKHYNEALAQNDRARAAALVKAAALLEAATSFIGFFALLLLAPLAAQIFAKDAAAAPLFSLYGFILPALAVTETATGVLQAARRFDRIALVNTVQSVITAAGIFTAFLAGWGAAEVLLAYLLGKVFSGAATTFLALRCLRGELGASWQRTPLSLLTDWRGLMRFSLSTNLHGTVNLLVRDSETLFVAFFLSKTETGYFRLAQGIINLLMLPIEPLLWPTYAEITRTAAARQWQATRRLLRRVSALAGGWVLAAGVGLALLGAWFIPLVYGPSAAPAVPAVLLLLLGYGFTSIFQWNRSLLLALGYAFFPLAVTAIAGLVKTALTLGLTPYYGYLAEAGILSAYFIVTVSVLVWRGLGEISKLEIRNSKLEIRN